MTAPRCLSRCSIGARAHSTARRRYSSTGYGAYGHAIPAAFSTNRLSLVDRGFVYAIAHIRGGSDCGYGWYLDGKLDKKTNTFADFIAAAEHLIAEGYTDKGQIAAHGGSAGGMLMGAVANMRPDLCASIVAEVPFVDVLNTMCDANLPLTPPEWPGVGQPYRGRRRLPYHRFLRALRECGSPWPTRRSSQQQASPIRA